MGTKILTDGWAGYKQLEKLGNIFWIFVFLFIIEISGYFWDFVNHSENFRKPEDHSVHTNTIQYKVLFLMLLKVLMYSNLILGKWFVIKRSLPRSGAYDLQRFCLFADDFNLFLYF